MNGMVFAVNQGRSKVMSLAGIVAEQGDRNEHLDNFLSYGMDFHHYWNTKFSLVVTMAWPFAIGNNTKSLSVAWTFATLISMCGRDFRYTRYFGSAIMSYGMDFRRGSDIRQLSSYCYYGMVFQQEW